MGRVILCAIAGLAFVAALAGRAADAQMIPRRIDVPVMLGGNPDFDACPSLGQIVGLDPNGDGFLSVRSGPGGQPYREIDRLFNGNKVAVCGNRGLWYQIVYPAGGADCGVGTPWPVRQAYTGPCNYGWVHSRYVRIIAG
ncbi:SH3 domain-containing protein [Terrarubrum flagellatum]|uniref:SH3 domain-containing protein n=1 Tax=Terrirubrum flagellatum TaxID=2895980 RepID=UPI003144ECDE